VRLRPRGVLTPPDGARPFELSLHQPAPELAEFVEHYWAVRWDLRGQGPRTQHVLSHPSVHLVAEPGRSGIFGVPTRTFTRRLEDRGRVFALKFRPAGFRPFLGAPVSTLTDRTVPASTVFGADGESLVQRFLAVGDESPLVELADSFVRDRLPAPDPVVPQVNGIVAQIMADREITRVDHLVCLTGLGKRALQRLFKDYVGVTPKWVIQRYRLHEAAERLAGGEVDLATLAAELGYFDQAHFARDFRAAVGRPPAAYSRGAGPRGG
jgi:AraC-like DNA-binding protein